MIAEELKSKSKEEVLEFIRKRLSFKDLERELRHVNKEVFKKEHRRFEMSGYEGKPGEVTLHNMAILNEFADLGIYDYTAYLFLDFYKGTPTIYLKYFNDGDSYESDDLNGYTTAELIYEVFRLTIFTGEPRRRRI